MTDAEFESGRNAVWNADFEHTLQGRPLGWTLVRSDHVRARQVKGEGLDGSAALRIEFLGKENLSFTGLSQTLVVEPGTDYRLSAHLRSEGITTDEGLFLEALDKTNRRVLVSTEPVAGTENWRAVSEKVQVPNDGELLVLRLRRRPSRMLDSKIRGKIWIDRISLEPVEP
jgi:hypothetical protein